MSERKDDDLLREVRERWDYAAREWSDIKAEGATDIRFVSGDQWDPKDKAARDDAKRPCLSLDELSQYVNQLINEVRQNKRAIKVTPMGDGANDASARLQESLIRQIEYRSNAQQAYTTMFENTAQRSYGFLRVKPRYVAEDSFDQELIIEPLVNPDLVTPDPDALRPDGSDMRYAFIRESYSKEEFKRRWPKARVTNFQDLGPEFNAWVNETRIWVAEYWKVETRERTLLLLNTIEGPQKFWADELESKPSKGNILQSRTVDDQRVVQYLTNGVEILEETEWPGKWIPLVCCYGKVIYVDQGSGAKRKILSMIRLARDPQKLYNYYRTTEAEMVGITPKTPYIGYEGQFRGHETDWQKANHEPVAYLEAKATTEGTGGQVLPLPQRQQYDPAIQSMEVGAEAARRAIQAAIGQTPLPTSAQRRNEKSGVALKQIEETAQKGSYHFIDHYDEAITRTGQILEDLIPHYYDTARDVTIRNEDDSPEVVRINDPNAVDPKTGQPDKRAFDKKSQEPLSVVDGLYDVTLSTGPSYDSQREAANELNTQLVQQAPLIAQIAGPQAAAKLMALAIKNQNIGAMGDKMADTISPPEDEQQNIPPQVAQQMQQMQAALQEAQAIIQTDGVKAQRDVALTQAKEAAENEREQARIAADLQKAQIDNATKVQIAEIQANTQFGVAELKASIDDYKMRLAHIETLLGHDAEAARLQSEQAAAAEQLQANQAQEREMADADRQFQREEGEAGRQQERELTAAQLQAQRESAAQSGAEA